jgi:hypothetical protein
MHTVLQYIQYKIRSVKMAWIFPYRITCKIIHKLEVACALLSIDGG